MSRDQTHLGGSLYVYHNGRNVYLLNRDYGLAVHLAPDQRQNLTRYLDQVRNELQPVRNGER